MPSILVDIDTQNDFIDPLGRLPVPGAQELVPAFARLFEWARAHRVRVVSSADCHAPDDPEFRRFPPHCVRGSAGQHKLSVTLLESRCVVSPEDAPTDALRRIAGRQQVVLHKTTIDVFENPHATAVLRSILADVEQSGGPARGEFIVFGVATDYCIRAAVLGLLRLGRPVRIVRDAVRGIADATTHRACQEMERAGAAWTSVADVTGAAA